MFKRLFCTHNYAPYGTGYDDYMRCTKCEHTRDRKQSEQTHIDHQPQSFKSNMVDYISAEYYGGYAEAMHNLEKSIAKHEKLHLEARMDILEQRIEDLEREIYK